MKPLIKIEDLKVNFEVNDQKINAVKNSNFQIMKGECFSIVGESGSGKSVTALSLMQLSKISTHLAKFSKKGGLYISILTYPTTGGVTASFGMQADVTIAEPKALIGFAGQRVIKQTTSQELPDHFQTSEFLKEKGFIDLVVDRKNLKNSISNVLEVLT